MAKFKIALCQHDVRDSVSENLRTAAESVRKAARRGADIAVLRRCLSVILYRHRCVSLRRRFPGMS